MVHGSLDITHKDNRTALASIRYILTKCCKQEAKSIEVDGFDSIIYHDIPLDFMHLKWIIDRCNFLAGKEYGLKFLDYDILTLLEEIDLVPFNFDTDWSCDYELDDHGWLKLDKNRKPIKKKKIYESKEEDWLSVADIDIMNKVIRRWKLYGKIIVNIQNWWYYTFQKKRLERSL